MISINGFVKENDTRNNNSDCVSSCAYTQERTFLTDTNSPFLSLNKGEHDPETRLKNLKLSNINRPVFAHININSLRNKLDSLKTIIRENIDILLISETKLDNSFPTSQFAINGYSLPFRLDLSRNSGGLLLYVRDNLPCRSLKMQMAYDTLEGIFIEINLRKTKWLVFGGYNFDKSNIDSYLKNLGPNLDHYMAKYENWIILGDFNSEMHEASMREFCSLYNLDNLIHEPTCFKNPLNPSHIDLILTNKPKSFLKSFTLETGLSDFHKMTVTVLRTFIPKQTPLCIKYRDFKKFTPQIFGNALTQALSSINPDTISYERFKSIFMNLLNTQAPLKEKLVRGNNAPFMTKKLSKAIMTRSSLKNRILKNPNRENETNFKKQRNYCVNLLKREKKTYYNS